ncbi:efflux RND transporter periplasmic adaptor subunit [Panacagrimonas sp.]|uniref:efflux RND transporter periplasmic adaptor subunit n=1 Tax=Panacagrimonas sp. TaxID=2480088 RepID=UPI003B52D7A4
MSKKALAVSAAVIVTAAAGGWWYAQSMTPHKHQLTKMTDTQGKVYYTCAMHPQVRQDDPGNCPICGMKLSKRIDNVAMAGGMREQPGTVVEIDPRMAQNLGMRTAAVTTGTFWQRVDAVGTVMVDERRIVAVEARAGGWVEQLNVRSVGDVVTRGQVLAGIYSPELLAAQEELALATRLGDASLIDAARTRLRLLGVSGGKPGAQQRVAISAPQSGVVTELMLREGAQISPGMPLMRIADLSQVWIVVDVPEAQASWVGMDRPAEARLKALPGRVFEGRVDYIYPILDSSTRSLRVRLAFDNADGALKPGMYADATLFGGARQDVTLVPSEAVIRTGTRNVVLIAEAQGRYRPVEVVLGPERENQIVILEGLQAGQQVVVSGQFLIDSEASLLGAYNRMGMENAP